MKGRYNSDKCIDLLKNNLTPFLEQKYEIDCLFQQDNASVHKSKKTMSYLGKQKYGILSWPPVSPDLNPMENIWVMLFRRVCKCGRQHTSVQTLTDAILEEWEKINQKEIDALIHSMNQRLVDALANKGGRTKW